MLCLHGEKCYVASTFKNGKYETFWYCRNRSDDCHFKCTEDQAHLYDKAVKKAFLASKQDRPKCCAITSTTVKNGVAEIPVVIGHPYAEMKVVTDMEKESFGRSFFVCSAKHKPCNYFAWGPTGDENETVVKNQCMEAKKRKPLDDTVSSTSDAEPAVRLSEEEKKEPLG